MIYDNKDKERYDDIFDVEEVMIEYGLHTVSCHHIGERYSIFQIQ